MRSTRTLKWLTVLAVIVGAALALISGTQPWLSIRLTASAGHPAPIVVNGSDAAPALVALGLAGLALALALAIAGRVARIVVGVLGLAVAVCLVWACWGPVAELRGGDAQITSATGIAGRESVAALVAGVEGQWWRFLPLAGALLVGLGSLAAVALGGLWPAASRRYESAARFEAARPRSASDAAVADWDELTRGDDPSAR